MLARFAPAASRRRDIMEMRRAGLSFREIGEQLGIGDRRAQHVYTDGVERAAKAKQPLFGLSGRARSAIASVCGRDETAILPLHVAALSLADLRTAYRIGDATVAEIRAWLAQRNLTLRETPE